MPDDVTLGVGAEIEASDHDLALLEVFTDGEGEQVLIDLSLQVQLFDEE